MGANSAQYLHHVIEAIKLGFADTTWYCADQSKVEVPITQLLSKEYSAQRRSLINPKRLVCDIIEFGIAYAVESFALYFCFTPFFHVQEHFRKSHA